MPILVPKAKRETLFVNMATVYDRLPPTLRNTLEGRTAKHDPVLRYLGGEFTLPDAQVPQA